VTARVNDNWVIRVNAVALVLWYVLLPFAGKLALFELGGTVYDVSRVIGLFIVYGNTILLFKVNYGKIPRLILLSSFLFLIYAACHVFTGSNFINSINVFVRVYSGFLLLLIFCGCGGDERKEIIEKLLIFMGVLTGIYILAQFAMYKINPGFATQLLGDRAYVASYSLVRPQGLLLSAGGSSSVMAVALIVLLRKILVHEFTRVHSLLASFMIAALLINFTRTYVFTLIPIFLLCLAYYRGFKALTATVSLGVVVLLLSFLFIDPSQYIDRFKDLPGMSAKGVSNQQLMQGRGLLMDILWKDFSKKDTLSQLTGNGLYYTNRLLGKYFSVREVSTHNDFLWLLSNMGLLGMLLYLCFFASAAVSYRGKFRLLFLCYLFGLMFMSGIGGETICVTGHRFFQVICLAYFLNETRQNDAHDHV
jgi:hypothetical protein